jgi:hypothetical protein
VRQEQSSEYNNMGKSKNGKRRKLKLSIRKHIKKKQHEKGKLTYCCRCGTKLKIKNVERHEKKCPKIDETGKENNTAECPICKENINMARINQHLDEHLLTEDRPIWLKCPICEIKILAGKFDSHEELHNTYTVSCKICGKIGTESGLLNHECDECIICFEPFTAKKDIADIGCSHKSHIWCLAEWERQHSTCPVCRKQTKFLK